MKKQLLQLLPKDTVTKLRSWFHGVRALFVAYSLLLPATKLKVIAITGTKGKTTTTVFLGRLLNSLGIKTGYISTGVIYLGVGEETTNTFKMTTIDPVRLQKYLKTMQYVGCKVVVLELSSQGLESNRHLGVFGFDYGVFLNLYPEHLDAHGTMENYANAKGILFENLRQHGTVIVNKESEYADLMLNKVPTSIQKNGTKIEVYPTRDFSTTLNEDKYTLSLIKDGESYSTKYFSEVEVLDFYWASVIAKEVCADMGQQLTLGEILKKSSESGHVAGRMEFAAHSAFADALVDYAHEPESMTQLMTMLSVWKARGLYENIIHVVSSDGVGRDDWKKQKLGEISYQFADFSYLTTDNYSEEDNPQEIVETIAKDLPALTKTKKYLLVPDRLDAMKQAFSRAKILKGRTLIVSTGVGSEFGLTRPNGRMEWSETGVWKQVFASLGKQR